MSPARRVLRALAVAVVVAVLVVRFAPRPELFSLAYDVDGPPPGEAAGVVVFLHGRGGNLRAAKRFARQMRDAGLPHDVSIVLVEAPYPTWFGRHWGDRAETQAKSRARVRALIHGLLGGGGPPARRVMVAGFSQGAGMAIDIAVEEPAVGLLASFSPCGSWLRGELPKRQHLRTLLAHGRGDAICPVVESSSLAQVLEAANQPVQYVEFDGPHTVPTEAIRALVALAASP